MELKAVKIDKPDDVNLILGQAHFIKTVEDLHEALAASALGVKFGLAFCESSGPCLVRASGTEPDLVDLAKHNAYALSAGHVFLILLPSRRVPDQRAQRRQGGPGGLHDLLRQRQSGGGDPCGDRAGAGGDGGGRWFSLEGNRDRSGRRRPERVSKTGRVPGLRSAY